MFRRLESVTYYAPNIEEARDWYANFLGMQPHVDEKFYVGFRLGDTELGLDPDKNDTPGGQAGAVPVWRVDNLETARARLIELGATSRGEVQDMGEIRIVRLADPFNNLICLLEHVDK